MKNNLTDTGRCLVCLQNPCNCEEKETKNWIENKDRDFSIRTDVGDNTISRNIDKKLFKANKEKEAEHVSSGKLSASMLGNPLQWQILKTMKAPKKPLDAYTLRKFFRGISLEDWLAENTPGLIDRQVFCEYRGAVGYLDMLVDHTKYDFKADKVPHEVKSVTGMKFKWIEREAKPDDGHSLQGAFYGLALGFEDFAIDYVVADDLRNVTYMEKTADYKNRIDNIIDTYDKAIKLNKVPVFKAMVPWNNNKMYNSYPEWADLSEKEIAEKVKRTGLLVNTNEKN